MLTGIMVLLMLLVASYQSYSFEDPLLDEWRAFSRGLDSKTLISWLRCKARSMIEGTVCTEQGISEIPGYYGRLGIFVTLKKGKAVRGCYGAFYHSSTDIHALLSDYLAGAMTRDPRYKPLERSELDSIEIIITITTAPYAVPDIESVDLYRQGIVATCDSGESIVFVPAELRDHSHLRNAMKGKSCQAAAFNAVTLR